MNLFSIIFRFSQLCNFVKLTSLPGPLYVHSSRNVKASGDGLLAGSKPPLHSNVLIC